MKRSQQQTLKEKAWVEETHAKSERDLGIRLDKDLGIKGQESKIVGRSNWAGKMKRDQEGSGPLCPMGVRYDEMATKYNMVYRAGGAMQNSIRVAFLQWILQVPGLTTYIGCIGKDKFGEEMKRSCKLVGVSYYEDDLTPTATCAVCVMGVERAKYFYIAGFFLPVSPDSFLLAAEHAAASDKVCGLCFWKSDRSMSVLKSSSYWDACYNQTENVEEIALKIFQCPKASVILLPNENLVDTNGAGDAFVGEFLSQLVLEKPIEDCTGAGCYVANVSPQSFGLILSRDLVQVSRSLLGGHHLLLQLCPIANVVDATRAGLGP
ncbi:Carbohydrate kinase PfkB [Dillenia turbinata]|uniref:Adenosine kinase n=1 Tax=Dillenia turbinata TaxID=194707 RepID=A0AAN8VYS3_9MAGN